MLDLSGARKLLEGKELNTRTGDEKSVLSSIPGYISTGSFVTDIYLGGHGLAYGRMHEFWGMQGSGKTTYANQLGVQCQRAGGLVFWGAIEAGSWDPDRFKKFGGDPSQVLVSSPECLEALFEYVYTIVTKVHGTIKKSAGEIPILIIVDSVNASPPRSLVKSGNVYADGMASRQRALADFMKILELPLAKSKICLLFLNQISANIGAKWGAKKVKSAGTGNQYFHHLSTSVFLDYKKRGDSGQRIKLHLEKLRTERPGTSWETYMYYYYGVIEVHELFEVSVQYGLLEKSGQTMYDTSQEGIPKEQRAKWKGGQSGFIEYVQLRPAYYQNLLSRAKICVTRTVRARDVDLIKQLDLQYHALVEQARNLEILLMEGTPEFKLWTPHVSSIDDSLEDSDAEGTEVED